MIILTIQKHKSNNVRPPSLSSNRNKSIIKISPLDETQVLSSMNADLSIMESSQSEAEDILPDMEGVLLKFGINPSLFREVPLDEYDWNAFTQTNEFLGSQTYYICKIL